MWRGEWKIRASSGTLAVIRGRRDRDDLPTTAYLMVGERCTRDCAFCPQARSAGSRDDLLSRVNWPQARDESLWEGLGRGAGDGQLKRACFQLTASKGSLAEAEPLVRRLHDQRPDLPICVSVTVPDLDQVGRVLDWGADRVTLAIDVAEAGLYAEVKGGSLGRRLRLIRDAAARFPGRIGTHLIAGLGETEKDLVTLFQSMTDIGVTVALFAFTPVPGTKLEDRDPPDLHSYRRVQAARLLIADGLTRADKMSFDREGRVSSYGPPWDKVRSLLLPGGSAFQTSGCPDCNRPYYNERPSGPLYNYPRPLTTEEAERAVDEASPVGGVQALGGTGVRQAGGAGAAKDADRPAWRLVVDENPRTGAWNMAIDEAVLLSHAAGKVPPTLRFYRWVPAAVSLGYFQVPSREVDPAACREMGIDIVRRQTGGRAVLHDQEVTYSVVVSMELLPGTVVETYKQLAAGLVLGLRRSGIDAVLAPEKTTPGGPDNPEGACFEVPSSYEIVAGGKKVVGSAQTRKKGTILQHGSILLRLDAAQLAKALGFPPAAGKRIAGKAAGLSEFLEKLPTYEEICRAVTEGLEAALDLTFEPARLSSEELELAGKLVKEKYGTDRWNLKRPEAEETEREDD